MNRFGGRLWLRVSGSCPPDRPRALKARPIQRILAPQPASANLFDLIAARAPKPDKLAIETFDGTALTYGELFERSARAAKALIAEIDAIEGVLESAVFGVPHVDLGEGVTAVVAPHGGAHLSEAAILSALAGRVANFKTPKRVLY